MRQQFRAITTLAEALKAVESDGYALQYVLNLEIFEKLAKMFNF